jgi:hypothetical protein
VHVCRVAMAAWFLYAGLMQPTPNHSRSVFSYAGLMQPTPNHSRSVICLPISTPTLYHHTSGQLISHFRPIDSSSNSSSTASQPVGQQGCAG